MKKSLVLLTIAAVVGGFYLAGCAKNQSPTIDKLTASDTLVTQGTQVTITCEASDPDEDDVLTYGWEASGGTFEDPQDSSVIVWVAPAEAGDFTITCIVSDGNEESEDTAFVIVTVAGDYFPLEQDKKQIFEGEFEWELVIDTLVLEATIVEVDTVANEYYLERRFSSKRGLIAVPVDTSLYYTVLSDSIFIYDPLGADEYLLLLLPLWTGKTWETGNGGIADVKEMADQEVRAGSFSDCFHIEVTDLPAEGEGTYDRDFWLAPDEGIIKTKAVLFGVGLEVELELVE